VVSTCGPRRRTSDSPPAELDGLPASSSARDARAAGAPCGNDGLQVFPLGGFTSAFCDANARRWPSVATNVMLPVFTRQSAPFSEYR